MLYNLLGRLTWTIAKHYVRTRLPAGVLPAAAAVAGLVVAGLVAKRLADGGDSD